MTTEEVTDSIGNLLEGAIDDDAHLAYAFVDGDIYVQLYSEDGSHMLSEKRVVIQLEEKS